MSIASGLDRFLSLILLTTLFQSPALAKAESSRCRFTPAELHAELTEFLDTFHEVGIVAAVRLGDGVTISDSEGLADMEWKVPLTVEGRFQVASVSKAMTAAVLLRLRDKGLIDLDAPIQRYLPDFPRPKSGELTLRLLAGHLGGIRHYRDGEKTGAFLSRHFSTAREAVSVLGAQPYATSPGTEFRYSSYGYDVIAAAIEAVTGRPFAETLQKEVLVPLGLRETGIDDVRKVTHKRVRGYTYYYPWFTFSTSPVLLRVPEFDYSYNPGGGNLLSTATDLVRFGSAMSHPGFLSSDSFALMTTPVVAGNAVSSWSFGWHLATDAAGRSYLHGEGSNPGFQANLVVFPQQRLAVAVLQNTWGLIPKSGPRPTPPHLWIAERCLAPRSDSTSGRSDSPATGEQAGHPLHKRMNEESVRTPVASRTSATPRHSGSAFTSFTRRTH